MEVIHRHQCLIRTNCRDSRISSRQVQLAHFLHILQQHLQLSVRVSRRQTPKFNHLYAFGPWRGRFLTWECSNCPENACVSVRTGWILDSTYSISNFIFNWYSTTDLYWRIFKKNPTIYTDSCTTGNPALCPGFGFKYIQTDSQLLMPYTFESSICYNNVNFAVVQGPLFLALIPGLGSCFLSAYDDLGSLHLKSSRSFAKAHGSNRLSPPTETQLEEDKRKPTTSQVTSTSWQSNLNPCRTSVPQWLGQCYVTPPG